MALIIRVVVSMHICNPSFLLNVNFLHIAIVYFYKDIYLHTCGAGYIYIYIYNSHTINYLNIQQPMDFIMSVYRTINFFQIYTFLEHK